ncbi:glycoside hydrolase domain-containing protein [Clostridium akagii]|uniref:glycoside hydrolase domain-containing protein n=1 Tax=Clostridium akagii TaxID=91623 RepID=UPI000689D07D|nr:glycoside hydrolase domain-containing protein [Clostridium akagii]
MDQMVLEVQSWLNTTYSGNANYTSIKVDGITGGTTVAALITALQIEIGISSPDGVFGPQMLSTCPTLSSTSTSKNEICILQGALYCKGYNPNGIDGTYGNGVITAIKKFQSDAGLTTQTGITTPMIFQAILNTDAYTLISGGDSNIRTIQQNLNRDYNSIIGLIPSNGVYSKSTNVALIKALQHEQGNSVDGLWGTNTMNACPTIPGTKATKNFILLLQYSLYCNGYNPNGFDGLFGNGLKTAITEFQAFVGLTADGYAGPQVWASLLVSTGDKTRKGTACDCSTTITAAMAATLKSNGYQIVGRYLTGKYAMTSSELQTIFSNGLKVFPIFEYGAGLLDFLPAQGAANASIASVAATYLGFKDGTTIYFAVDFDALDSDVTDFIIPYFEAISNAFATNNNKYSIGIYGPRNVCSRVAAAGYSVHSFACDMSTGFSGNLGYKLPSDWSFDQIATITIGSGAGAIEIDNDICHGTDLGVSSVTSPAVIIDAVNSTGLAKLLKETFDAAGDPIQLVNTANVKVNLEFSLGASEGNGSSTLKFKNGEFEDATVQTAFEGISAGLSATGAAELTTTLAKLGNTELSIQLSYTANSITISIETETTEEIDGILSEEVSIIQTLTIELSFNLSDTGDLLVQDAKDVASSIEIEVEKYPVLEVVVVLAVIAGVLSGALEVGFLVALIA